MTTVDIFLYFLGVFYSFPIVYFIEMDWSNHYEINIKFTDKVIILIIAFMSWWGIFVSFGMIFFTDSYAYMRKRWS